MMYGVKNKYITPLFKPWAAEEPASLDVSAVAVHMAHWAVASVWNTKTNNTKREIEKSNLHVFINAKLKTNLIDFAEFYQV